MYIIEQFFNQIWKMYIWYECQAYRNRWKLYTRKKQYFNIKIKRIFVKTEKIICVYNWNVNMENQVLNRSSFNVHKSCIDMFSLLNIKTKRYDFAGMLF